MELKRDEILKWWELCANDITCRKCPYEKVGNCQGELMQATLDIFKELTEENESLGALNEHNNLVIEGKLERISALERKVLKLTEQNKELTRKLELANLEIECKERICESYMLQYGTVADKEVWLKKERADTVRKMQQLIEEKAESCNIISLDSTRPIDTIYQISKKQLEEIAKEMIGEAK